MYEIVSTLLELSAIRRLVYTRTQKFNKLLVLFRQPFANYQSFLRPSLLTYHKSSEAVKSDILGHRPRVDRAVAYTVIFLLVELLMKQRKILNQALFLQNFGRRQANTRPRRVQQRLRLSLATFVVFRRRVAASRERDFFRVWPPAGYPRPPTFIAPHQPCAVGVVNAAPAPRSGAHSAEYIDFLPASGASEVLAAGRLIPPPTKMFGVVVVAVASAAQRRDGLVMSGLALDVPNGFPRTLTTMAALYRFDYIEILPASRGFRNASGEQHIRSRTSDLTRVESPTFSENQFFAVWRATFAKLCQPRRSASLAVQRPARLKPNRKFDFLASAERRYCPGTSSGPSDVKSTQTQ
ncbi:hypothetical protein R3P38DRAFT_3472259 [Favolaschia claudopus]|uniref:Uncharacterized protein n=1 Tax=Favolaschia claudopus TaxID=2862362 RepID=A0AAV9ZCJ4_9AGAR